MNVVGTKNPSATLESAGLHPKKTTFWNLSPEALVEQTIQRNQGVLADSGAICIETGEFTGRSPKDRFIVKDDISGPHVAWGKVNLPFEPADYDRLREKVIAYMNGIDLFVRDAYACAEEKYRMNIRVINEYPWSNQFANNMFLRPSAEEVQNFTPEWTILNAPGFMADPAVDKTRQHNFAILNFTKKEILIGGTGYTGEIKKGIFSALNFLLPHFHGVFPMHCSSNIGKEDNDVALFFGLSGTGKTTLSADPNRPLIGDDEHGWHEGGVFNFEGGCYAKTIDLTAEKEPDIFNAIRHGAILENIKFYKGTRNVDFEDSSITQNTRVSYPIEHIDNAVSPSKGGQPTNVFFLTCDAYGVLPPISKMTPGQAMYHFISGYTAKVAGTELGVTEPQMTFSACFGSPFLPLHPTAYAAMLGEKMNAQNVNVWLINTGWSGGAYGEGSRMSLKFTRAMITAALNGKLDGVKFQEHEVFGLQMPVECPGVPDKILSPRNTWADKDAYDQKANFLAKAFNDNFEKFADEASEEMLAAAPKVMA